MKGILVFCVGVMGAGLIPELPSLIILVLWLLLSGMAYCFRTLRLIACVMLGSLYGLFSGYWILQQQLAPQWEGEEFLVVGTINDLPVDRGRAQRFQFSVDKAFHISSSPVVSDLATDKKSSLSAVELPKVLLISWYNQNHVRAGQNWQLRVKLKRPRGFVNEGGFDYQRWLLSRGIGATGYVRESNRANENAGKGLTRANNLLLGDDKQLLTWLSRCRQIIRDRILMATRLAIADEEKDRNIESNHPVIGPLLALTIGDKSFIDTDQWKIFQATGTAHLMAISGLHVGFIALLGYWLGHWLRLVFSYWCARSLTIYFLPSLASFVLAGFYATIAGFALPTQRALVMVFAVNLAIICGRRISVLSVLSLALFVVLLVDPLAGFESGFWLSFGAVGCLCWSFFGRRKLGMSKTNHTDKTVAKRTENLVSTVGSRMYLFTKSQLVVFVGLAIPLFVLNLSPSLVAPIANLVAIPVVTFSVVLPLLLSSMLAPIYRDLSLLFFNIAVIAMEKLWQFLVVLYEWQASAHGSLLAEFRPATPSWLVLTLAVVGILLLLSPRGVPGKWLGIIFMLPVFVGTVIDDSKLSVSKLKITLLDVGQGLATIVKVGDYVLVYDVGPKFSDRFNAGDAIVASYLRSQGITSVDTVVISHGDDDHAGGALAFQDNIHVKQWWLGEDVAGIDFFQYCDSSHHWQVGEVSFKFLNLPGDEIPYQSNNNQSCVLLIEWQGRSILFPGDIERGVERSLLAANTLPSAVEVLVAPHHGSISSSHQSFVEQLQPKIVLFSAGYKNRYGHPHRDVVQRYQKLGSKQISTALAGQITLEWLGNEMEPNIQLGRSNPRRYWYSYHPE